MNKPYCYDCMQSTSGECATHRTTFFISVSASTEKEQLSQVYLPDGNYRIVCGKLYRVIDGYGPHKPVDQKNKGE